MGAAEDLVTCFYAVADNFAPTVVAFRCRHGDRAFEAVEDMPIAVLHDFKRLVIIIPAKFTFWHGFASFY